MPVVTDWLGGGQEGTDICVQEDFPEYLGDTDNPCCLCHFGCSEVQRESF